MNITTKEKIIHSAIKFIILAILVFVSSNVYSARGKSEQQKKLYISTIKAVDVKDKIAMRVKEGIRLSIFNGFGDKCQVLDDNAIKIMYKQAEQIMASGCTDQSCITQIAEGINADEIIYGEVSSEGGNISINITNMERQGTSLRPKKIVQISFLESQIDWYSAEIGKQLMEPGYIIKKAPDTREDVKLGSIEIKPVKGLDISVINFKSSDEKAAKIINISKEIVSEGDNYFNQKKWEKACSKYSEVINRVNTKLTKESQAAIKGYIDGVYKRLSSTYLMHYKSEIDIIDSAIKEIKNPVERDYDNYITKYNALKVEIEYIPEETKDSKDKLNEALNERIDVINIAICNLYEKRGLAFYNDYKFAEAMEWYQKSKYRTEELFDEKKRTENFNKIAKMVMTVRKTGEGYLLSQVKSLTDVAETFNFKEDTRTAKSSLKQARKLITGPLGIFATYMTIDAYNKVALVLSSETITILNEPELFNAVKEGEREYESLKKGGVYKVGDIGPAGGFIFYDKGKFSDGWRYLEVAPVDQGRGVLWGCNGLSIPGATGNAIGTGKKNTNSIIKSCEENYTAAKLCIEYRGGKKRDWFLPSKDELVIMSKNLNKANIGGFANEAYWTSTEYNSKYAYYVNLPKGRTMGYYAKNSNGKHVRAIRAF